MVDMVRLVNTTVPCPGLQEQQRVNDLEDDGGKREPILVQREHIRNHDCCTGGRAYLFPDSAQEPCSNKVTSNRCEWMTSTGMTFGMLGQNKCPICQGRGRTPTMNGWVWQSIMTQFCHTYGKMIYIEGAYKMSVEELKEAQFAALLQEVEQVEGVEL